MELFTNKYAPKSFDDLVLDKIILRKLKCLIHNLQNVIFVGSSGIGKTSAILCLMNEIYGDQLFRYKYELKTPEDIGLSMLYKNLTTFCKKKVINEKLYKVIIINDADCLNVKVQQMLNSVMEQFFEKCKFLITCIDSSNILETIQSKCVIIKFPILSNELIVKRLKYICECEKLKCNDLEMLATGDLRNAILKLQIISIMYNTINRGTISKVLGIPAIGGIKKVIDCCIMKDFEGATKEILEIKDSGYLHLDILSGLLNFVKNYDKLSELMKINYFKIIASIILDGNNGVISNLQLLRCVSELCF